MSNTFHVVVLVDDVRKEFDVDPFVDERNGFGIYEGLEHLIPNMYGKWNKDISDYDTPSKKIEIIEVDGIQFGESRGLDPFTACMICDGCEDGRLNMFIDGDERSAHIIPCLFNKYIKLQGPKEA